MNFELDYYPLVLRNKDIDLNELAEKSEEEKNHVMDNSDFDLMVH